MHRENISVKNFIGLKPRMSSPVNLSTSTVLFQNNTCRLNEHMRYSPKIIPTKASMDRYKQCKRLLEWNTGLDYWTELFSFFEQVSEFIFGSLIFMITSIWLLWMIVIMTTIAYCSVFINK